MTEHRSFRRFMLAGLGAVLVGAVGSGVWDVVAKPGLSLLAVRVLTVITLGSQTVRDLPYSSAALDPSSLPSLILMGVGALAILFPIFGIVYKQAVSPRLRRHLQQRAEQVEAAAETPVEGRQAVLRWLRKRLSFVSIVLGVYLLVLFGFAFASFAVVNEAIFVRRVFQTNLGILGPHVSAEELLRLRSEFAQMTNRSDWEALSQRMRSIATAEGVNLRVETPR